MPVMWYVHCHSQVWCWWPGACVAPGDLQQWWLIGWSSISKYDKHNESLFNGCNVISMAYWKTAVTPLLTHWSYCSLAISHQYVHCRQWGRDKFEHAPSQWEKTSQCNIISHWLGAYTLVRWLLVGWCLNGTRISVTIIMHAKICQLESVMTDPHVIE